MAPSRMLVQQDKEWLSVGESAHTHTVRLMNSRLKSKKNDDKSAVAMLKKGDWTEVDLLPTKVTIDQGNLVRKVITSWNEDLPKRRSTNARQLGCVFQDMTLPKSILRKSTDMQNQSNV